MAGAACKIIIDNMREGIARGLEQVLTSPLVRGKMLDEQTCNDMLQTLVNIDLRSYTGVEYGGTPLESCDRDSERRERGYGYMDIIAELVRLGVFTDEVWVMLRHPDNPRVPR
jgi:hypothetical protein